MNSFTKEQHVAMNWKFKESSCDLATQKDLADRFGVSISRLHALNLATDPIKHFLMTQDMYNSIHLRNCTYQRARPGNKKDSTTPSMLHCYPVPSGTVKTPHGRGTKQKPCQGSAGVEQINLTWRCAVLQQDIITRAHHMISHYMHAKSGK